MTSIEAVGPMLREVDHTSRGLLDELANPARYYRYVRFLPEFGELRTFAAPLVAPGARFGSDATSADVRAPFLATTSPSGAQVLLFAETADNAYAALGAGAAAWRDPSTGKAWHLAPKTVPYAEAAAACGAGARAAKAAELDEARQHGFGDAKSDAGHALAVGTEAWVTPASTPDRGTCPYTEVGKGKEFLTIECGAAKAVACVGS
jgi:hypothetical protein